MTFGVRRKIERYYENMQRDEVEEKLRGKPLVEEDIVGFCEKRLGFKPTSYQEKLFRDQNQFIVGIWSRQSGKSQALAVLALYRALAKPKARIVVLAPSPRQSRKIVQRVGSFLSQLPDYVAEHYNSREKPAYLILKCGQSTLDLLRLFPAVAKQLGVAL